jgi:hypothetical protein
MTEYAEINDLGECRLTDWLRRNLKEPDHAEAWAAALLESFDGSDPRAVPMTVELRDTLTRTGAARTYVFGPDEYVIVQAEG